MRHGANKEGSRPIHKVGDKHLFLVIEVQLQLLDIEYLLKGQILLLMREVAGIEEALFVLINCVALYIVHDDPEGVVPVAAIALKPDMDIVDIDHCVVHDPDEVLLGKGLFLVALVPLLLHLHLDPLDHALQQLVHICAVVDLLVANVQQHVDPLYVHEGALLLQARPRNVYVDLLDVAEF